jgi:hypothetical protein
MPSGHAVAAFSVATIVARRGYSVRRVISLQENAAGSRMYA